MWLTFGAIVLVVAAFTTLLVAIRVVRERTRFRRCEKQFDAIEPLPHIART